MNKDKKKKEIFIVGVDSRLGYRVQEAALRRGYSVVGTSFLSKEKGTITVDITKKGEIRDVIKKIKPEFVIHAAAYTDVDKSEKEKEIAWRINVTGSENVAEACRLSGAKLINVSTDYVFDGKSGPYSEDDIPNPINVYGKTKLEAEKRVHAICKDALTIRTCVPYDWNPHRNPNFMMWLIGRLEAKSPVRIVTDQMNTPTFNPHLAEVILDFCDNEMKGIIHVSGREFISRCDFALKLAKIFKFDKNLITPCETKELSQLAPRPMRAGLKVERAEKLLKCRMLTIEEGLKKVKKIKSASA